MSRIYEALQLAESEQQQFRTPEPEAVGFRPDVATAAPQRAAFFANELPCVPWNPDLSQLPTMGDHGPAVEQFRSLRSRIYQARDHQGLTSILVSSGTPAEGKSFVAANLAVILARNERSRVLLIDGDLRRSRLDHIFGTRPAPGLADYLAGTAELNQIMRRDDGTRSSGVSAGFSASYLTFIPAGVCGGNAAELIGNRRFDELIAAVSPYFDWIIVDSSPVLAVSDAANLARPCDAVLLVARGGVTPYEVAQRAHAEFRNSRVLGFVLNAVPHAGQISGYGYGFDAQPQAAAQLR